MPLYYMLHKPWGHVTARKDDRFPTVMDLLPPALRPALHPVGRLDKETEGLLLLTDDGSLDRLLLRPERHIRKEYFFWAFGTPTQASLDMVRAGVPLRGSGVVTGPAEIIPTARRTVAEIAGFIPPPYREDLLKNPAAPVFSGTVIITEGKRHQIRRTLRAAGHAVIYLRRTAIGALALPDDLARGEFRPLTEMEFGLLRGGAPAPRG